ncbi:RsmB/NOP family class I SAM-dependent RNA methyltransferase [Candidatus Micrarchaeota archaeon]|nr:RsmB/NOP family class I SAM-dependent RNA methyltransferase [Candidatus Micrarchaeota archaeon]
MTGQAESIPAPFRARYCPLVDDENAFLASLSRLLPKAFRINTLKSTREDVSERFAGYGIGLATVPWYEDAFVCDNPEAGFSLEHFTGAIYMQELVSMLPPLLIRDILPGARMVLDGCAAPGSKTTQLAALMGNRGTIIANDVSYSRIRALKFNLEKVGALNTVITNRDLMAFPDMDFDAVIIDAPCSAEGTIRKNWEVFDTWSARGVQTYARVQKQLIVKGFDLLAPGGTMVYSTCTFAPEENEAVVDELLKSRPDAKLEPIAIDGLKTSGTVESWDGAEFDPETRKAVRIWPHHNDTGGFFLAKVKK